MLDQVEDNRSLRLHKQWPHCPTVVAMDQKRRREVVYKGRVAEGRYLIVPATYRQGECTNYYLRVFSRRNSIHLRELKEDIPRCPAMFSCVTGDYEWATVVTIHSAECLTRVGDSYWKSARIYPYCRMKCETKRCSTPVARDDLYPTWNNSYVFYRKKTDKPLTIQVYSRNLLLPDSLLGECQVPAPITRTPTPLHATLIPRISRKGWRRSGDEEGGGDAGLPPQLARCISPSHEDNFMAV
ncbi:hypothetical protein LSTR_LSTR003503 [Laodelphax striatellus]|uniref:C2 domain-containing protein n=1 Tax=Laodelphax striatellus TaxID=195883 RepID=A0A482X950_LAOST|nr:hypothetical protein LSTR_LSTR003503 [Laodelphax striatellus]